MSKPTIVALIPARAGSKRVPGKNTRPLAGHPLLVYAIAAAQEAGIFEEVIVSSDSEATLSIASKHGAWSRLAYGGRLHTDEGQDIDWIQDALLMRAVQRASVGIATEWDAFAIIRPTSPFRRGPWIAQAWRAFLDGQPADSLRAVRRVAEHPGKVWAHGYRTITPLLPFRTETTPWHSQPTQGLPQLYVQTAALEIAWVKTVIEQGTISGDVVLPYLTEPDAPEAIDINVEADFERAERLAAEQPAWLPPVRKV